MANNQTEEKKAKGLTVGLLVAIIIFLLTVFLFWRITDEFVLEKEAAFDLKVFQFLTTFISPAATKLMLFFTFFGSTEFLLPAYLLLAAFFLLYKHDTVNFYLVIAIGLTSKGLLYLLKNIFRRTRPLEPLIPGVMGYSYPSGHSFSAFTFFGLITYLVWNSHLARGWKWCLSIFFILIALCTGLSRVYLHVHFASDVMASFCLAVLWLIISLGIVHFFGSKKIIL